MFNLKAEWKFVKNETLNNVPKLAPYPEEIVKLRGWLITAQVLLSEYPFEGSVQQGVIKEKYLKGKAQYQAGLQKYAHLYQ